MAACFTLLQLTLCDVRSYIYFIKGRGEAEIGQNTCRDSTGVFSPRKDREPWCFLGSETTISTSLWNDCTQTNKVHISEGVSYGKRSKNEWNIIKYISLSPSMIASETSKYSLKLSI